MNQATQTHPEYAFLRLPAVLALIPVSRSTWWAGVKAGRFPTPVKLGTRITAWRVEDIRNLAESFAHVTILSKNGGRQ